jgi:hypothetical protein
MNLMITFSRVVLVVCGCGPARPIAHGRFEGNMNTPASNFAHRYPDNGRVESICLKCLLMVCSCRGVEQMMEEEAKHVCQPDAVPPSFRVQ